MIDIEALKKRARQIIDTVFESPVVVEVRAFSQPEEVDKLENKIVALLQLPAPASTVAPQEQSDELAQWSSVDNWPLPDVLNKLANATECLLNDYNYDRDGWEQLKYAALAARRHVQLHEQGWQYTHERDADLIRKDKMMCEVHPGLEFGHDAECGGPGMAWVIEGRAAIESLQSTRISRVNDTATEILDWLNFDTSMDAVQSDIEGIASIIQKKLITIAPASPAAPVFHCSCGAACTPEEYAAHRAMGHNDPAALRDEAALLSGSADPERLDTQEDKPVKNYDDFRAGMLRAAEIARNEFKRAPEAAKGHDCVYMGGYEDACDHLSAVIAQAAVIDSVRIAGPQPDWQYHISLLLPDGIEDKTLLKIYQVVEHELRAVTTPPSTAAAKIADQLIPHLDHAFLLTKGWRDQIASIIERSLSSGS